MRAVSIVASAALVALVSVAAAIPAWATDRTVTIVSGAGSQNYSPSPLTINPGDTVHWINNDGYPHNAACSASECPEAWSSGPADTGPNKDVGSHTFRYSGRYIYHCVVHGNMTGEIDVTGNVQAPAPAAPTPSTKPGSTPGPTATSTAGSPAATAAKSPTAAGGYGYGYDATPAAGNTPAAQSQSQTLAGLALPKAQVKVESIPPATTSIWVFAGMLLLAFISALLFGWMWFGPPRRTKP